MTMWESLDWRYWSALAGTAIWVAMRDAEKEPIKRRLVKTFASALLGAGLSHEAAPFFGGSEMYAGVCITALGIFFLDLGVALITDRELIKELVRSRFGKGGGQ